MKKLLCLLTVLGLTSAYAEQWEVPLGKKPSNKPVKNTVKASGKLDFIGFKTGQNIGIRVRNGKHKMGEANISIDLGTAQMVVERVDIMKPMAKIIAQGDGEHLLDTFKSAGKPYEIFCTVKDGKIVQKIIVRSKEG